MTDQLETEPTGHTDHQPPSSGVRPYRFYTEDEKAAALETLNLCGGNVAEASRLTGINKESIRLWSNGEFVSETTFVSFARKRQGVLTAKVQRIADKVADAMLREDKIESARYGELNAALGTAIDKLRLIQGQPTSITEHRAYAPETLERAAIVRDRLVEHYGDEQRALIEMRKVAPTLWEALDQALQG